jgi:O-antigen/teichoic acid export membrane protein
MRTRGPSLDKQSADPAAPPDLLATEEAGPAAIRGGALRVGGYGIGVALSVFSAALLFRHLGVVDSGRYVTILSLVALVGGLTEAGLTAIGVREFATAGPEGRIRSLRALLGMRISLTLAGVAGAIAFAGIAGYGSTLVLGTALAGLGLLLQSLQSAASIPLQAELRLGWVTVADLARQLVTVGAIVALVAAGAGLLPFLAIAIPAGLASLVVTVAAVHHREALLPVFRWAEWAGLMREALPYAVTSAVGAFYFRLAIIVMSLVATDVETGYFAASFRIIDVLIVVPQLLVGAAFPIFARAARDDRTRLRYALQRSVDGALIFGIWTAVCLVAGADLAIKVVAGPDFAPAADVLRIQAGALLLAFLNAVLGYALLSLGRYRALLAMALAALLTVAVLTPPLADAHGAVGGAIATVAGEAVVLAGGVVTLLWLHPELPFSTRGLVRIAVAGLAALATVLIGLPDVPAVLLATAVFFGLLFALRAFPDELIVETRRLLATRGGARAR